MSKSFYFLLISLISISNIIMAADSQAPYRTIRAGEAYTDPLSGEEVAAGNRTNSATLILGFISGGPNVDSSPSPFFSFYCINNTHANLQKQFEMNLSGIYNYLDLWRCT